MSSDPATTFSRSCRRNSKACGRQSAEISAVTSEEVEGRVLHFFGRYCGWATPGYQLRLAARIRELVDQGTALEAACRIIIWEDQLAEALRINEQRLFRPRLVAV